MSANLFDLTARISVDAAQSDRALANTQRNATAAEGGLRRLDAATRSTSATLRNDLGGALSTVSPQLGALIGATGVLASVGAGLSLIAAGAGLAGKGIWSLANYAAQAAGDLKDMAQQTNYSVETLSALKALAATSGTDIEALSSSLIIFQKNLAKGDDIFKKLGITSKNNETALRQSFIALNKISDATTQTAAAMEIFGRSGKAMIGVIKESNGNLDEAMKKLRDWGLIVSTEDAEAADRFSDDLEQLEMRLAGVARVIGAQTLPAFTAFFETVDAALDANAVNWKEWGERIAMVVLTVETVVGGLAYAISQQTKSFSPGGFAIDFLQGLDKSGDAIVGRYNALTNPTFGADVDPLSPSMKGPRIKIGGGGSKGGGGSRKNDLDGLRTALTGLNTEYRKYNTELLDSANATALAAEKEKLLTALLSSAKPAVKERISEIQNIDMALDAAIASRPAKLQAEARALLDRSLAKFKDNQQQEIAAKLTKQSETLLQGWRQEVDRAQSGADEYAIAIEDLEKAYAKYGVELDSAMKREAEQMAAFMRMKKAAKELSDTLGAAIGKGWTYSVSTPTTSKSGDDIFSKDSGAALEDDSFLGTNGKHNVAEAMAQKLERQRQRIHSLASDLSLTITNALSDGFENGISAGLKSFEIGILQMIQSAALKALEDRLTKMFTKWMGGSQGDDEDSGSGFLASIFGGGGSGGGKDIAGTIGTLGKFAGGGQMRPNTWNVIGERGPELFWSGPTGGTVIPNNKVGIGAQGHTFITNIYVQNAAQVGARETLSQAARKYNQLQQRAALMGA